MRLDHLLSKEPLGTPVWSSARLDGRQTPGRCTGYSAGELARAVRKYVLPRTMGAKWNAIGEGGEVCRAHCSALGVRASEHLENSIASASIYSQVTKGLRWMPWRQEPMKDVAGSEMLRGAASKL